MRRNLSRGLVGCVAIMVGSAAALGQQPAYRDASLPIPQRVADLLGRMTLEEKVAQVRSLLMGEPQLTPAILADSAKMRQLFHDGMGMVNPDLGAPIGLTIAQRNAVQRYVRNETRLGIPVIFIDEAHHGLLAPDADVFPHAIGIACSWDTTLIKQIYTHVAAQARGRGTSLVLAPVVDVDQDPRWGRTGETFGEDPYLNGVIGSAVVEGLQGSADGTIAADHVAATLKHFAGHGRPEGGINAGPDDASIRTLREMQMEPFRLIIQHANPAAIMAAYTDLDGVPAHANHWLLTDVLRHEWHFNGVVVSDWFAIDQLWKKHFVASSAEDAARQAFNAGVTVDLPYGVNYAHLADLVREGKVGTETLDTAVAHVLTLKFKLGLFEQPTSIDSGKAERLDGTAAGRQLALRAAEESMVLLKNADHLLPIRQGQYHTIAVIGPGAAVNYLGDYSGIPMHNVSMVEALRQKVGPQTHILYAPGVRLTQNGDSISFANFERIDQPVFPDPADNARLIGEAVRTAQKADLVIVAVGENEQLSRESWTPHHFGDANTLELQSDQDSLVKALVATGKPVVAYLMHGRPLSVNWIAAHVPAIVDGWFTGEESGTAFANILFGDVSPSGKLTISDPKSVGQIPVYYNHKPSAQFMEYVTGPDTPLYPFGYGLSYTTFDYANLRLARPTMSATGTDTVSVDITNTGSTAGDEIVQLYVHPVVSSVTRPVKLLKDFARIHLNPGERQTVRFAIDAPKLAFWRADMTYGVEPGKVEVMVGRSSADVQTVTMTVTE